MTPTKQHPATGHALVADLEAYINQYVAFAAASYSFVAALWAIATYLWPSFDAFPYLVISSAVKRSGKTRFSEVLDFLVDGGHRLTAATMGSIYAAIRQGYTEAEGSKKLIPIGGVVLFIDEAETLSREDASGMRAVLNGGYRLGVVVPRWSKSGMVEWPVYCPKVFILIGDVFDTLRDRSIVIEMWRGEPAKRFNYNATKAEGAALGVEIRRVLDTRAEATFPRVTPLDNSSDTVAERVARTYEALDLPFLMDRDEEIWRPLFALCQVLAPARVTELKRIAVDLATLKTQEKRTYRELAGRELSAEQDEYARRLLADLYAVVSKRGTKLPRSGERFIYTKDAVAALREIDEAPWRTFRGEGLNDYNLADLLKPMGVAPALIKSGTVKTGKKVARGYRKGDVERALKKL